MKTNFMLDKNIHSKIIRLFTGEAKPDEKKEIGDWLNQSKDNQKLYNDLQEIWLSSGIYHNSDNYNLDKAINKFLEQINRHNKKVRYAKFTDIIKYAAIFILLISLPVFYFLGKNEFMAEGAETTTTVMCDFGDKSKIILPDGSQAFLNSGTTLTFNNDFQSDFRSVYVEGEAYFTVKKNKEVPFKVKTCSGIEIEVLGTEFNLKAYPNDNIVSTTLVNGSVRIKSAFQETTMQPHQKLVYNRTNKRMVIYSLNEVIAETEWKDGRLVFRNESLEELEKKLERWFDVDIEFADQEVKKRRYTGTLERESILEAISYFGFSEYVGYEIKDNVITFYTKLKESH